MPESTSQELLAPKPDEIDRARAQEYALLATLLSRSPDSAFLSRLAGLRGDASPMGAAHAALAEAATRASERSTEREFFVLFAGLGGGTLLPYSSHYMAETLYGRPLVRVRESLQELGIERADGHSVPEDHAAILLEVMGSLADGAIAASAVVQRKFFQEHLSPWIERFFVDLERAKAADFYSKVGLLGRAFVNIEEEAFSYSE